MFHSASKTIPTASNRISLLLGIAALTACSLFPATPAQAQSPAATKKTKQVNEQKANKQNSAAAKNTDKKNADKQQKPLAAKRIKELMSFAEEHHPEILPLMEVLKKNRPERFKRVTHGLDREVRSLERVKQRSADAYDLALKQWTNRSRVRLLSAQVSTAKSIKEVEEIRRQIRRLLKQNQKLRIKGLEQDLDQAQARANRITKLLKDLRKNGDETIDKKIEAATKLPYKLRAKEAKKKGQTPSKNNNSQ